MLAVAISEKGGPEKTQTFDKAEVTIGRVQGNDIVLPKQNVSKRHARIVVKDGKFIVVDLKSTNGTYVNGRKISSPQVIKDGDKVYVGDFVIALAGEPVAEVLLTREPSEPPEPVGADAPKPPAPTPASPPSPSPPDMPPRAASPPPEAAPTPPPPVDVAPSRSAPTPPPEGAGRDQAHALSAALRDVAGRVSRSLPDQDGQDLSWEAWREQAEEAIYAATGAMDKEGALPSGMDGAALAQTALAEALGLGCLESLLNDDQIEEIVVNGPVQVYVDSGSGLELTDLAFGDDRSVYEVARRLVSEAGLTLDMRNPVADVRRGDGARVRAVIPPVSVRGTVLAIRKAPRHFPGLDDLVTGSTLSATMANFLEACVRGGRQILVAGPPASGRTTLIGAIASTIPNEARIVTVEEAAELQLPQDHVVPLEAFNQGPARADTIGLGQVLAMALRLCPEHLVVGEVTRDAALETLRAMAGQCKGSVIAGLTASDPRDAISRLETLCLMDAGDLPVRAIREYIVSAIDVVVTVADRGDGQSVVTHISSVTGMDVDLLSIEDIFSADVDPSDPSLVQFSATGFVPRFFDDLQRRGLVSGQDIFRD